jgi:hypothetical protein
MNLGGVPTKYCGPPYQEWLSLNGLLLLKARERAEKEGS